PTEPLATALRELKHSAEVCVVPTFLDFDHPRWNQGFVRTRGEGRRIHIGWSGGSRVGRDLEIMAQDLVRVVRRHANVTVVIAGALKYAPLFSEIPKQQFCGVNWVTYDYYPRLLTVFDL